MGAERRLIFPFPLTEILLRGGEKGALGALIPFTVLLSIVVLPVLLLIWLQLWFVRYHAAWITGIHQLVVVADLALLWSLWPSVFHHNVDWLRRTWPRAWKQGGIGATCAAALFALLDAIPVSHPVDWRDVHSRTSLTGLLGLRNLDLRELTLVRKEPSPEVLAAYGSDNPGRVDQAWRDHAEGLILRGRDLRGADFTLARMTKADLRGANLRDAILSRTRLGKARFDCWVGNCTELQGANLRSASLQGANLRFASLQGADLRFAGLQGADLRSAGFQGADLRFARLHGADLRFSGLQGADLSFVVVQGADLRSADLQGANFGDSQLRLSDFRGVKFDPITEQRLAEIKRELAAAVTGKSRLESIYARLDIGAIAGVSGHPTGLDISRTENAIFSPSGPFESWMPGTHGNDPKAYFPMLVEYLKGLVCRDKEVGIGLARRSALSPSLNGIPGLAAALLEQVKTCFPPLALPDNLRNELEEVAAESPT